MMLRAVLASIWLLLVLISRGWLEVHMARHMLLQFPLLLLGGMMLAGWLSPVWRRRISHYNQLGLNGMVYVSLLTTVWMIPNALDLALAEPGINLAKLCSLFLAGVALRLSWQPAGRMLQGFFLIGWAMMSMTVGMLYGESGSRLCNAYLESHQISAGNGLIWLSVLLVLGWCLRVWREQED
jgi:hypothetical protein